MNFNFLSMYHPTNALCEYTVYDVIISTSTWGEPYTLAAFTPQEIFLVLPLVAELTPGP